MLFGDSCTGNHRKWMVFLGVMLNQGAGKQPKGDSRTTETTGNGLFFSGALQASSFPAYRTRNNSTGPCFHRNLTDKSENQRNPSSSHQTNKWNPFSQRPNPPRNSWTLNSARKASTSGTPPWKGTFGPGGFQKQGSGCIHLNIATCKWWCPT